MSLSDEDRQRIDEEEYRKLAREGLAADTQTPNGERLEPSNIEVGANYYQRCKVKAKCLAQLSYGFVRAARPDVQSFVLKVFPYALVLIASLSIWVGLAAKEQFHQNDSARELVFGELLVQKSLSDEFFAAHDRAFEVFTLSNKTDEILLARLVTSTVIFCIAFVPAAVILRGRWSQCRAVKGAYRTGVNAFLIALIAIAILWTPIVLLSWLSVSYLEPLSLAQRIDKAFFDFFVILPGVIAWTAYPLRRNN